MPYLPIKSIARTDQSDAQLDSTLTALTRALKSTASSDESDCDLTDTNTLKGLHSSARTDACDMQLVPTFLRSIQSEAATDSSQASLKTAVTGAIASQVKSDASDMQIPGAGVIYTATSTAKTDSSDAQLSKLARGLGLPPSGSVSVLWTDGDRPLDRLQLRKGGTYALSIRVQDERFAGYVVSLEAIANAPPPTGPIKIVLSSDPKIGGIDTGIDTDSATISPIETKLGPSQELLVSADWLSEFTSSLPGNTVFDFKLVFEVPLFQEYYPLQSGQFLVVS